MQPQETHVLPGRAGPGRSRVNSKIVLFSCRKTDFSASTEYFQTSFLFQVYLLLNPYCESADRALSRHCKTSMRFVDNSSVHGDDYDIKVTLAGHLLLDSVRQRHCCEVWSFLMLEGWLAGQSVGCRYQIRSSHVF